MTGIVNVIKKALVSKKEKKTSTGQNSKTSSKNAIHQKRKKTKQKQKPKQKAKKLILKPKTKQKPKAKPKPKQKAKTKQKPKPKQKTKPTRKPKTKQKQKAKPKPKQKTKKPILEPPKPFTKARALKLIKHPEAEETVFEIAGEDGLRIFVELLKIKGEIDEFTLAEKAELQINYARSLLYKLYEQKLVAFSRERDKKKGWFIYSWQAFPEKIKELLLRKKEEEIEQLEQKSSQAQDTFVCEGCKEPFEYAKALETMFFCDSCGGKLRAVTSKEVRDRIEKQILDVKKKIKVIEKF
ncbi:MAG TPA: hypothetical protein ENN30_02415 [Candidatus Woesearchaeota archaeon]|nr:hypothetical protein [Candidatus Woesearchaeota archaeon]